MRLSIKFSFLLLLLSIISACNSARIKEAPDKYQSETLIIEKVSPHVYQHRSFLETQSFGKVSCNGMIVFDGKEAVIFDTPTNDKTSLELIDWVKKSLNAKVTAVVPTHFHTDCLGGLEAFHKQQIPSYVNNKTIELAAANNEIVPQNGFGDILTLSVGDKEVIVHFLGEGHTRDNVIGYFPAEHIMFGGCLIKEVGAGKGNLADANIEVWPSTVAKVKATYPKTKLVIPGHGKAGDTGLLDYTIKMFE